MIHRIMKSLSDAAFYRQYCSVVSSISCGLLSSEEDSDIEDDDVQLAIFKSFEGENTIGNGQGSSIGSRYFK